ncbi:MAG: tripartite tricarboxylate transporter substrate binding protein [Betaproteobacteria bacterium]
MAQATVHVLHSLLFAAAASACLIAPGIGHAQSNPSFPSKAVTLVVPYTPNSGSDIIARIVGPRLSERWGQPVIVDNKPGASGTIGTAAVAKAAPDGYTLLMMINSITMAAALVRNAPYDMATDLVAVARLADAGFALGVNAALPVKDMAQLLAYIKAHPGKLSYASPGNGTPHHLGMSLLLSRDKLNALHVPYKGISAALTDVMGGHAQMILGSVHSLLPGVQSGKIRLLAVGGDKRSALAPDVPTFHEQGIAELDGIDAYYGVMAPVGMPAALVDRLHRDFLAVVERDDVKAELAKVGLVVKPGSAAQLGASVRSDLLRWAKVIKDTGITAD